jgi:excisionase family DNA binding protein
MSDEKPKSHGPEKRLLTVTETAAVLGCSRANVYGLIEAGELPVIAVGKSRGYRIDCRDIDEFIERRKTCKEGRRPAPPATRPRLKHIKL